MFYKSLIQVIWEPGIPVWRPNSGAQKRFFNFLFFCCNSTKKYVEEVEMAWKTKNKQDVELKEGTVYKSVFIHLNNT